MNYQVNYTNRPEFRVIKEFKELRAYFVSIQPFYQDDIEMLNEIAEVVNRIDRLVLAESKNYLNGIQSN